MIFIFDMFGVVVRWSSSMVIPQLAKLSGVSAVRFRRETKPYFERCDHGRISMDELWARIGRKYAVPSFALERVFRERFVKAAKLNLPVVRLVKSLKKRGKVCLMSNQWPLHSLVCREKGWFDVFDKVFLSHEIGACKPERETYRIVLKRLRAKPSDCVFVDDKPENVAAAESFGMVGVLFKNAAQLRRDLEKVYNKRVRKV